MAKQKTNDMLLQQYRSLLTARNYAKSTVENYHRNAALFVDYLDAKPLAQVDSNDLQAFLDVLAKRGYRTSTLSTMKQSVKHFVKVNSVKGRKIDADYNYRTKHILPLTAEKVVEIINCVPGRYRLMFAMIYCFGLKKQTLLAMRYGDISLSRQTLTVRSHLHGDRRIPIPHQLLGPLENHLLRVMLQHELDCLDDLNNIPAALTVYPPADSLENQFLFQSQSWLSSHGYRPSHEQSSFTHFIMKARRNAGMNTRLSVALLRTSSLCHQIADGRLDVNGAAEFFNYSTPNQVFIAIRGVPMDEMISDPDYAGAAYNYVLDHMQLSA